MLKSTGFIGLATCLALGFGSAVSSAQIPTLDQVRAARRSALLMARSGFVPEAQPTTSVVGVIASLENQGVANVEVRLRNLVQGEVSAVTRTDGSGAFSFEQLSAGTYLVEIEAQDGNAVALGDVLTVAPGETVATFVKMPAPLGWTSTLASLLGAPGSAADDAAAGNTAGSSVTASRNPAGTFSSTAGSVVSSAASAGVTGIGGGRAASNDDQPR